MTYVLRYYYHTVLYSTVRRKQTPEITHPYNSLIAIMLYDKSQYLCHNVSIFCQHRKRKNDTIIKLLAEGNS